MAGNCKEGCALDGIANIKFHKVLGATVGNTFVPTANIVPTLQGATNNLPAKNMGAGIDIGGK